jgi:hypothetical protein
LKKNIVLLAIAIGLATFTYYFQEVGDKKERKANELEGRVLDPEALGELKGFSLSSVEISKQGGQYLVTSNGQLADERKIESFMQLLSAIKIKRKLSKVETAKLDRQDIFPENDELMTFVFANAKVIFRLGKKLSFDRSFYMEVQQGEKRDIVIAFDSSDLNGVYQRGDAHRAEHHYKRFQSLFYLDQKYFLDYRIFRNWMKEQWSLRSVDIDNSRNRAFRIDFINASTNPKIPTLLSLDKKKVRNLEKSIALLEGKSIGSQSSADYGETSLGVMKVESSIGEALLSLHTAKNDLTKFYIHSSLDNFYYEVTKAEAELFKGHVQLFWKLKFLQKRPELLEFTFGEVNKKVRLIIEKGLFKASGLDNQDKPKHFNIKKLSDLLQSSARYWVSGPEVSQNYISQFELDWGQGPFYLMIRTGELLVYDKKRQEGLVYTFNGKPPIGLVLGDYFL